MSVESKKSDSVAEAGLLRLLSHIYLKEVDGELVQFLAESGSLDLFGLTSEDVSSWGEAMEDELAVEFCRLFVTPGVCVPLASAFLGGSKTVSYTHLTLPTKRIV